MKKRAFLYVILAGIFWGTAGVFGQILPPYGFTPFQITAIRGTVSCLCILVYALIKDRQLFRVKPADLLLYLGIGISLFGTSACYYVAMQLTSISTAVVLMYMSPVYVMAFSVLFFGEKLSGIKLISVVCVLIGGALVSGITNGMAFDAFGIFMAVLSGVAYGAYNILTKVSMRRNNSPITTTAYSFMFMSVIALSVCEPIKIVENTAKEPMTLVPMLLALGVVTFVLPYFLFTLGMRDLPAGTASSLSVVEPMTATLFSIFIFGEKLTAFSALGIVLILASVVVLSRVDKEKQEIK